MFSDTRLKKHSLPLVVKSAVCAGSSHPPTAKPALQANRQALCCMQMSTRGHNAARSSAVLEKDRTSDQFSVLVTCFNNVDCEKYKRELKKNYFSGPGQLCRVGSQPVCIRTSCANPCKTDHGQDCPQHPLYVNFKSLILFLVSMERLAGFERRRLEQLLTIPEGIALVSV